MTKIDQRTADRVLTAACIEVVRQVRAGEPHIRRYNVLRAAVEATALLLDPAA